MALRDEKGRFHAARYGLPAVEEDDFHLPIFNRGFASRAKLHRLDVLGTRAFGPFAFGERNLLAFLQIVEAHALDAR